MAERRLVWNLFPSYLLVTLAGIAGVSAFSASSLRETYMEQSRDDLRARVVFATEQFAQLLDHPLEPGDLDEIAKRVGTDAGTRVTVLRPDGTVLADTAGDVSQMESHAGRPEVIAALRGEIADSIRYSTTVQEGMLYVAAPIERSGAVVAVVRLAVPMTGLDRAIRDLRNRVFIAAGLFAGLAALVNWWVSKRLVRPIEQLTRDAQRFAQGERYTPLPQHSTRELHQLSDAMTHMAEELEIRIEHALEEKAEREAVLRSMVEGVVAVDRSKRVLNINRAASVLLGVDLQAALGRRLPEVVRNAPLNDLVDATLAGQASVDAEFELHRDRHQFIQARSAVLRRANNEAIGAVIVLNDVTRIKQLEQVRKDFVSNVSHELKTPLTTVKGFVETLQDGAIDNPDDARRFLGIIGKHVNRLNAILEDLLTLSRLEQGEGESPQSMLEVGAIAGPIREAVQVCSSAAEEKRITIRTECPGDLLVQMNAPLIEQCVVNLLDNAIKYSEPGKAISVTVARQDGSVEIAVSDQGSGIPSEHLGRLFERFYRVDQARSRSLGGTGLGLSIVRHIVELHDGTISVESELGEGSTFRIMLPAAPSPR